MRPWWTALAAAGAVIAAPVLRAPDASADPALELAVVVNSQNPRAVSLADLAPVFTTSTRELSGKAVTPFNLPPQSPERALFDKAVLNLDPEEAASFWIDRKIRGGNGPPRQAPSPELMLRVVAQIDDAIGYLPANRVDTTVRVVARVQRGKLIKP